MSLRLRVRVRGHWYTVEVGDQHANPMRVLVDGEPVDVHIEGNPGDGTADLAGVEHPPEVPQRAAPDPRPAAAIKVFNSPMPGVIVSVAVRVGDRLVTGDEVCVLEAMKMHQTLRADWSGIVRAVHAQPGKQVLGGDPLVELE